MNENIKIPKFPDDFFHFSTDSISYISDITINSWIKEGLEELENSKKDYFHLSTGDSCVEIYKSRWKEDKYIYNVVVSRGRYEAMVLDKNNPENFYKGNY